jgi:hypothetical protein
MLFLIRSKLDLLPTYTYILLLLIFITIFFFLNQTFQASESWIYWSNAKEIENGLPTLGRSPLYTIYLNIFGVLNHMTAVKVEWVITSFFCLCSIFFFINTKISKTNSLFICIILIPYIWINEPRAQIFGAALAFLGLTIYLRNKSISLKYMTIVLLLILAAGLARPNYFLFFIMIIFFEFYNICKSKKKNNDFQLQIYYFITALIGLTLLIVFWKDLFFISSHKWNNPWGSSIGWFPGLNSGLLGASFIGHYNWYYIENYLANSMNTDFYFTHEIAYNNAENILEMVKNNPKLFTETLIRNLKIGIYNLSTLGKDILINKYLIVAFSLIILISFFKTIIKFDKLALICSASLMIILISFASYPKDRYLLPIIPIMIITLNSLITLKFKKHYLISQNISVFIIILFFLNSGFVSWGNKIHLYINTKNSNYYKMKDVDLMSSFKNLKYNLGDCNSIITLEHSFFNAFLSDNVKKEIIDIWEIPPFGYNDYLIRYHDKKNLNCIAISHNLENSIGLGTNIRIRFLNHILPYQKWLIQNEGETIYIKNYGKIIKLKIN